MADHMAWGERLRARDRWAEILLRLHHKDIKRFKLKLQEWETAKALFLFAPNSGFRRKCRQIVSAR